MEEKGGVLVGRSTKSVQYFNFIEFIQFVSIVGTISVHHLNSIEFVQFFSTLSTTIGLQNHVQPVTMVFTPLVSA